MDILTSDLEATIAFHSDAVVGSASGKNHSGCQSPERDTEANDELVRQVQGLESVVITTTPPERARPRAASPSVGYGGISG
jgi:hypothetical protein